MTPAPAPRLLLLTEAFPPPISGGSEVFLYELARRVAPDRTLVIGPDRPGAAAFDAREPYAAVRLHLAPTWRMRWDAQVARQCARFARRALAPARAFAPDVVLTGQAYPTGSVGLAVSRAVGAPLVVVGYGEELFQLRYARGRLSPLRRRLLRAILRSARAAIGPSHFAGEQMIACGLAPDRFHVVYPGAALEEISPSVDGGAVRTRHGLAGRRVLLSCGRLVARKGVDVVIDLLPALARVAPDLAYVVAGEGPERPALEARARARGVADRIVFTGAVPRETLPEYYAAADVLVMAYRQRSLGPLALDTEGFGIVLAEAGAAGKPVVSTRVGGTPDAVVDGETGYLLEEGDAAGLEAALVRLLEDPALRARLGRAGRARVERELNWTHAATRVREILEAVIAEVRAPAKR